MSTIENAIKNIADGISSHLPNTLGAILLLVVGFFVAGILRKLFTKGLNKLKIDERIKSKTNEDPKLEELLASIGYFTVIAFTVLLALDVLGIRGVLDPIKNMITKFMDIVPNLVACGIICFAGYILARIVCSATAFASSPLDKYSKDVGLGESFKISKLLSKMAMIFIYIPVLIAALDALKIKAISAPAQGMLSQLLDAVPRILAASIILGLAFILGRFASTLLKDFLKSLNADKLPEKIGVGHLFTEKFNFSSVVSGIFFFYVILGGIVEAVKKLGMSSLENLTSQFILFFSQITLGLVILGIGSMITNALFGLADKDKKSFSLQLGRYAVHGLVIAMGLNAMGLAETIVNMAFGFSLGAIAVAFALAFGLGGREAAGKQLEDFFAKMRKKED